MVLNWVWRPRVIYALAYTLAALLCLARPVGSQQLVQVGGAVDRGEYLAHSEALSALVKLRPMPMLRVGASRASTYSPSSLTNNN